MIDRDVRRALPLLALLGLLVAVVSAGVTFFASEPEYHATASLKFGTTSGDAVLLGGRDFQAVDPDRLAAAGVPQVTDDNVVRAVRRTLRARGESSALAGSIDVRIDLVDSLVKVEGTADTSSGAATLANAYATQAAKTANERVRSRFRRAARALVRRLGRLRGAAEKFQHNGRVQRLVGLSLIARPVSVSRPAVPPQASILSRLLPALGVAALLGLLLGVIAAIARARATRAARNRDDVSAWLGLPVAGDVSSRVLDGSQPGSEDEEAFRRVGHGLASLDVDCPPRLVLVTSAVPGEGKSSVASGLARALAGAGHRIMLVESDLRRPVLAARLGLEAVPGLREYLEGATLAAVLREVPVGNGATPPHTLHLITAGDPTPGSTELIESDRFRELLSQLREQVDLVILDGPPLLPVADSRWLSDDVDAILLCCRLERTTRAELERAAVLLPRERKPSAAVIVGKPGL